MMVLDHHYHQFDKVRSILSYAVYPLQWLVDKPVCLSHNLKDYFLDKNRLVLENEALRQEQLLQNGRLQKLVAFETENERLRALLQQSLIHRKETLAIAEILQVDADPFSHRILIDKGKNHQVKVGQPIIDAEGVMGEIIEVNELTATAILITDASHAIPVEIARNSVRGILVGTGSYDHLTLQYLPKTAEVQMGDVIVTSGLGGRYPAGYPVGTVTKILVDPADSFITVFVAPKARLDRGRQVLLVDGSEVASATIAPLELNTKEIKETKETKEIKEIKEIKENRETKEASRTEAVKTETVKTEVVKTPKILETVSSSVNNSGNNR